MIDHLLRCFLCGLIGCLLLTACIQPPSAHTIPVPATTVEATAPVTETATVDQLASFDQQPWTAASPDGIWQIEGLTALPKADGEQYYTEMRVKKADGSAEWVPVATWSNFGLGYTTPQPLHWSPDGRYLYFTNAPVPDGCGLFINASDLQRLNLADGTVTEVLPYGLTWSLAIAPDGETVAYNKGDELYLLDLVSSNVTTTKVEGLEPNAMWGNFVWSPDSQQIAFTIAYAPCQPPAWRHSIVVVDRQRMAMTTVLEKDPRRFKNEQWIDAGHLLLSAYNNSQWMLDLNTREITEASAMLTPQIQTTLPNVTTQARQATLARPKPWVIFVGVGDGQTALYAMSPHGGELYTVAENALTPFCAPDGTAVAFMRRVADKVQLFAVNADGTEERQLTTEGENFDASWSPDSTQLAFVGRHNGSQEIYTMQRDGSIQTPITANTIEEFDLAWSPMTDQIAFYGRKQTESVGALYLLDRQTRALTNLTAGMHLAGNKPDWSPDGSRLVFSAFPDNENDAELYTVDPDAADLRKLTDNNPTDFANLANEYEPRWSPDGTQIAFYADYDGVFQVYLMNADGSNIQRLTYSEFTASNPCWLP